MVLNFNKPNPKIRNNLQGEIKIIYMPKGCKNYITEKYH